jgi:hypothetical protein
MKIQDELDVTTNALKEEIKTRQTAEENYAKATADWKKADEMKRWIQDQLGVTQQRLLGEQVAREQLEETLKQSQSSQNQAKEDLMSLIDNSGSGNGSWVVSLPAETAPPNPSIVRQNSASGSSSGSPSLISRGGSRLESLFRGKTDGGQAQASQQGEVDDNGVSPRGGGGGGLADSGGVSEALSHSKDPRTRVAKEILDTEQSYVSYLRVVVDHYVRPLNQALRTKVTIITKEEIASIFSEIEVILNFHTLLLRQLHDRLKNWTPQALLADIFLVVVSSLFLLLLLLFFFFLFPFLSSSDRRFPLLALSTFICKDTIGTL